MIVETAFLFWPVQVLGVTRGWVYGTSEPLETMGMRELLGKNRIRFGRRRRGLISGAQAEEAFLHHEDLGTSAETRRILLETAELDRQRYCEPAALCDGHRAREAFQQFVNLEDRRSEDAVDFIQAFGLFDYLERKGDRFVGRRGIPAEIQQFCAQSTAKRQSPFAVSLTEFWSVRDDIIGLCNLASAIARRDVESVKAKCVARRPKSDFRTKANWVAVGKAILCADLSASINPGRRTPRVVLHEINGKLVALTMGTTVRSALYLTLLNMIVSKTACRICPNCKKRFVVLGRPDRKFCTDRCRNANKVRKWRDRQEQKVLGLELEGSF